MMKQCLKRNKMTYKFFRVRVFLRRGAFSCRHSNNFVNLFFLSAGFHHYFWLVSLCLSRLWANVPPLHSTSAEYGPLSRFLLLLKEEVSVSAAYQKQTTSRITVSTYIYMIKLFDAEQRNFYFYLSMDVSFLRWSSMLPLMCHSSTWSQYFITVN